PWPVLELTSVSLGNTSLTINTDVEAWPDTTAPIRTLRLTSLERSWYRDAAANCDGTPLTVTLGGIFGIHRDYTNAWSSVDTLAAAIISTTSTTFTVADVDGADEYGLTPRVSPGHLVRIDDEIMEVTATNTTTNVVTVRRG